MLTSEREQEIRRRDVHARRAKDDQGEGVIVKWWRDPDVTDLLAEIDRLRLKLAAAENDRDARDDYPP